VRAKENPGVGTGASEDSAGGLNTSTVAPIRPSAAKRFHLSETADAWITERAHDLATGAVSFWQLPPSLVEFYYVAFFAGRDSLAPELTQAQREADRLYRAAYGPKVAPEPSYYLTHAQLEQFRADLYAGAK
jgi:hypothetical protein